MDHVRTQRAFILALLLAVAITAHGVVFEFVLPYLKQLGQSAELAKAILTAGAIYSSIVLLPMWFYDKYLWKRLNPKYDLSGRWLVSVKRVQPVRAVHVTKAGQAEVARLINKIVSTDLFAEIEQTPFRARVISGAGYSQNATEKRPVTWNAEIVTKELPGAVSVVFEGVVDGSVGGRDHITVKELDERGRPNLLIGDAYHVFSDFDVVIRGDIEYRRVEA
jgi:hypothetical protein